MELAKSEEESAASLLKVSSLSSDEDEVVEGEGGEGGRFEVLEDILRAY